MTGLRSYAGVHKSKQVDLFTEQTVIASRDVHANEEQLVGPSDLSSIHGVASTVINFSGSNLPSREMSASSSESRWSPACKTGPAFKVDSSPRPGGGEMKLTSQKTVALMAVPMMNDMSYRRIQPVNEEELEPSTLATSPAMWVSAALRF
jgi:hypothetical protein